MNNNLLEHLMQQMELNNIGNTTYSPYGHSDRLVIAGIDPGTINLGIAYIEFNIYNNQITSTSAFNINAYDTHNTTEYPFVDKRSDITTKQRMEYIMDSIHGYSNHFQPNVYSIEGAFFKRRRPSAFEPLIIQREMIRSHLSMYPMFTYQPNTVKATLGASKFKGKEPMKEALSLNRQLMITLQQDIDTLSEHAIDAIGIAYTHYCNMI